MIWVPHGAEGDGYVLAARVKSELAPFFGAQQTECLDEVSRAMAAFFLRETRGALPDAASLAVLASRALSSLGEGGAARRLLLFGTGMARPAEWEVTGSGTMWVLDLRRITVREDSALEMILFRALGAAVEALADVWDGTQGRGVLGLRHVCGTAAALLGTEGRSAKVAALVGEIVGLCVAKLEQVRQARSWRESPLVMNLDL